MWRIKLALVFSLWAVECCAQQSDLAESLINSWLKSLSNCQSLEYRGAMRGRFTHDGAERHHSRYFKAMKDCRFFEIRHYELGLESEIDRTQSTISVIPGKVSVYNHFNRTMEISTRYATLETNVKLEYSFFDFYLVAIGWIPERSNEVVEVCKASYWPFALASSAISLEIVDSNLLSDDGSEELKDCVIIKLVSKNFDMHLWFDPACSVLPFRIEQVFDDDAERIAHAKRVTYEYSDWIETPLDFCLPKRITRKIFVPSRTEPIGIAELKIEQLAIDSLEIIDFNIPIEPGTFILNFDSRETTAFPGGLDLLERVITYGRRTRTQDLTELITIAHWMFTGAIFLLIITVIYSIRPLMRLKTDSRCS